jgi:hypothetical protein
MFAIPFDRLPDDARLWVFTASRPLTGPERETLLARVDDFLADWRAHGRPVIGGRDLRHDRFLLVGADERASGVSGCSIDALYRALGALESELGVGLRDSSAVHFRDEDGNIRSATRAEFRDRARAGEVTPDTIVFDNTATTVGQVRDGRWETPLSAAWHARAFPVGASHS